MMPTVEDMTTSFHCKIGTYEFDSISRSELLGKLSKALKSLRAEQKDSLTFVVNAFTRDNPRVGVMRREREEIAERFSEARHAAHVKVVDLAKQVKVSRTMIYNIEGAVSKPSIELAAVLAEALGVSAKWLMTGAEENNEQNKPEIRNAYAKSQAAEKQVEIVEFTGTEGLVREV